MPFRAIALRGLHEQGFRMRRTHEVRIQQRVKRRLCPSVVRVRHPDHERVRPDIEVIAEVPV